MDNLLVRIHISIEMIWWTGLARIIDPRTADDLEEFIAAPVRVRPTTSVPRLLYCSRS